MEFNSALELAQGLKDPIEEKKAARGLGLFSSFLIFNFSLLIFRKRHGTFYQSPTQ